MTKDVEQFLKCLLAIWDSSVENSFRENNERDILIEGAIMGLGRNLVLGKLPGTHKDDPS